MTNCLKVLSTDEYIDQKHYKAIGSGQKKVVENGTEKMRHRCSMFA